MPIKLRQYLLAPVSGLYQIGNLLHRLTATSRAREVTLPVISVGGISAGGSGKTPFVRALIKLLEEQFELIVLTRGYGRKGRGEVIVEPGHDSIPSPDEIGDEPALLAREMKRGWIGVGSDRGRLLDQILQSRSTSANTLVLLDDGFQHYRLARDLDIVMVDEWTAAERFLLPSGYLREPPSALRRADVLVVSGERGEEMVKRFADKNAYILKIRYEQGNLINWKSGGELSTQGRVSALLVTGIARSERVARGLYNSDVQLTKHLQFRDHHSYTKSDVELICQIMAEVGAEIIVTTEKDAVKLEKFRELDQLLYVLPLHIAIAGEEAFTTFIQTAIQRKGKSI